MQDQEQIVIALTGPTAVGKTEVALALAERLPVALISLDSAMVYREMDIGTAKPAGDVLEQHPHALIDIRDPADPYSAAEFLRDADAAVRRALAAGRVPLLVGGTMLYLRSFRDGLAPMPAADPTTRARLVAEARESGTGELFARLEAVDPIAAERIHPHNFSRLQRALEVYEISGRPISSFWSEGQGVGERLGVRLLEFAIEPDARAALHERISRRFDAMLAEGFVAEVERLKARGDLHLDLPSMRAVGYRQIWDHLEGVVTEAQMRENAKAATRQLAKRQLTWLRGWPQLERLVWGDAKELAGTMIQASGLSN